MSKYDKTMAVVDRDVVYKDRECIMSTTLYTDGEIETVIVRELVRCKDCKHRPTGADRDDLEFPDDKCPCKCEDYWYSWKPADEWYCGNGERNDGDHETDQY